MAPLYTAASSFQVSVSIYGVKCIFLTGTNDKDASVSLTSYDHFCCRMYELYNVLFEKHEEISVCLLNYKDFCY